MDQRVYLSPPDVGELEEQYLIAAIRSGWVAPLGPDVDAFEATLAEYSAREHCVALSSGTAALHLGLLTLGVNPGDVVVTSTMTFAATANSIVYAGAQPYYVDSDGVPIIDGLWVTGNLWDEAFTPGFTFTDVAPVATPLTTTTASIVFPKPLGGSGSLTYTVAKSASALMTSPTSATVVRAIRCV